MNEPQGAETERLRQLVREIPDFPAPGVLYKDITPLLNNPQEFQAACKAMTESFVDSGVTHVLAIESRGFLFGAIIASQLNVGLVPLRKAGKLPAETVSEAYSLEYGANVLEMHIDALGAGARALVIDDVLATGGTAAAAVRLAARTGAAVVGCSFFIELLYLGGRAGVGAPCASVLRY